MLARPLVLRFAATFAAFGDAATSLREVLAERRIEADPRYSVELAFEEIAGNIIRHGRPTGDVNVEVGFRDDEIVLTFEDDGVPFDPRQQPAPPEPSSLEEAEIGGLGLMLVRKFTSRIEYERTGDERNRLTLAIPLR
jgi:anti-sigma regulatory factor (Ser/Thr protein kinase)